jgi:hypothetical protein
MNKDWLKITLEWAADTFDTANPAIFKLLAIILPYLTPIPVAMLTASSAATFLGMDGRTAGILVFAIEGLGVLFTSLLVESVNDKFKKQGGWAMPIIFSVVVLVYIFILVSINVTLHNATGDQSGALKTVITLLCFLPLLSGVGSGYYRLKLNEKADANAAEQVRRENEDRAHQLELERQRVANENEALRLKTQFELEQLAKAQEFELAQKEKDLRHQRKLEKLKLKTEGAQESSERLSSSSSTSNSGSDETQTPGGVASESTEQVKLRPRDKAIASINQFYVLKNRPPSRQELISLGHDKSTASRALDQWYNDHPKVPRS